MSPGAAGHAGLLVILILGAGADASGVRRNGAGAAGVAWLCAAAN